MSTRSFGRPDPAEPSTDEKPAAPVPVLHVGEVHADLRLHLTEDTLHELGSQIATMIANATKQGFDAGMTAALDEMNDDDRADEFTAGEALIPGAPERHPRGRTGPVLTDEDMRRARGE